MSSQSPQPPRRRGSLPGWLPMAAGIALLVAAIAAMVWYFLFQDPVTSRRPVADTPMLMLPPPPPPPPEPPPEPEPVEEETMPEPEPLDEAPTPAEEEEAPTPDNSDPVTMDADAQAGSDSFGIQSGSGGGMRGAGGGGAGNASYGRWLGYALQQVIARDDRARRHAFQLQLEVWLDRDGVITRVELARGSGNAEADAAVLEAVRNHGRLDERPPASLSFPARVLVQGRRPVG